jgi:hypothetical protein
MSVAARIAATAVVLAVLGVAIGESTWSAFSGNAANAGDTFAAGTVTLGDNDAGSALTTLARARPGDTSTGCLNVTYSGSLSSSVKLYASVSGSLAPYLTVEITRGTQGAATFPSCTGFTPDARDYVGLGNGVLYRGPASGLGTSYAAGLTDPDASTGGTETWTSSESHVYRVIVTMGSDPLSKNLSASVSYTVEARNL